MAQSKAIHHVGDLPGAVFFSATYQAASFGTFSEPTPHSIKLATDEGYKIVFYGAFDDAGGDVTGTVDGYVVYMGNTKIVTVKNLSFSFDEVEALIDAFKGGDFEAYRTLTTVDKTIGTGGDDILYAFSDGGTAVGRGGNDDLAGGDGRQTLKGGKGNDVIWAGQGNDRLIGGKGKDFLSGSQGSDTMKGGKGADSFYFWDTLSVDTIRDFKPGQDRFLLESDHFGALTPGFLPGSEFRIGKAAKTADQRVIYDKKTGGVYYDADGAGGAAQVQFAQLDTHLKLNAGDFFVGFFD